MPEHDVGVLDAENHPPHHGSMTIYFSIRCLRDPVALPAVLELYRMGQIKAIALAGPLSMEPMRELEGLALWVHQANDPQEGNQGINLAAGDEDFRMRSLRRAEATLAFAARHGARNVSFMSGYALEETFSREHPSRPVARSRSLSQLKRSLDRLAVRAESMDICLTLTNSSAKSPSMLLADAREITAVLDDLQIPCLGLQIDLDHLAHATQRDAEKADAFLASTLPYHRAVRLHENHQVPPEGSFSERLLAAHSSCLQLPWILAPRQLEFSRLLAEKERLERLKAVPTLGPALPRAH